MGSNHGYLPVMANGLSTVKETNATLKYLTASQMLPLMQEI